MTRKDPPGLDEYQMLIQRLLEMYGELGKIETWLKTRHVRGGTSQTRNKLIRARWYLEHAAREMAGGADAEYGSGAGTRIMTDELARLGVPATMDDAGRQTR